MHRLEETEGKKAGWGRGVGAPLQGEEGEQAGLKRKKMKEGRKRGRRQGRTKGGLDKGNKGILRSEGKRMKEN